MSLLLSPALLALLIAPAAYLIALFILFIKHRRTGLLSSLLAFIAAISIGTWAIFQSRSSTAAIGMLFVPFIGAATGALVWGFANLRQAHRPLVRALAWLCLLAGLAILGWEFNAGWQTIQLYKTRDAAQQARTARIAQHQTTLTQLLAQNKGEEAAALMQFIAQHARDEEALYPALASEYATPAQLDHYARKDDFGLTLTALRNKNCSAATLARIYRSHTYPNYFLQTLAAHEHTPPDILREIFQQSPRPINGLDSWLATNPTTPKDVLQALSDSHDIQVLQSVLQNPQLDCAMLQKASAALAQSARPDDSYSVSQIAYLRPQLCRN